VRSGIKHQTSDDSRGNEGNSSDDEDSDGPVRQQGVDIDLSSLGSVGEVVVSGRHVVESSSLVHLDETSIEVGRGGVELHAVLDVGLNVVLVVGVLGQQIGVVQTVSLSQHSHVGPEVGRIEEGSVGGNPRIWGGFGISQSGELNHVGPISLGSSFSSVSGGVGVTTSPLEVDEIVGTSHEVGWHKVVLSGGISLNDVSSLSSYVEVENSLGCGNSRWSGQEVEHVRPVLEGSSELRGIGGELHGGTSLSEDSLGTVPVVNG